VVLGEICLVIGACCPLFKIRLSPAPVVLFLNKVRISSSMVGVASIQLSSGSGLGQFFLYFQPVQPGSRCLASGSD
jgi:hypothetical protein